ncbi:MAG: dockerin type I domain-containing protein [Ruminococcus callidus]
MAYCGAGMSGNLTDDQIAAADIDGDGSVDSTDVYYILYYVALQGAGKNPTWDFILGRK